ncbi:uncharacterized protein MONOS_1684 [Monocercomonoides exilis]|uniref:uncharacterized protein n=1 Tax=Monocercomonoides exilis TaxID=2049356 RepID=UPI00355AAE8C|nr:hypothetical protein MONOS_1684 [Monocercomonoides exilis]|eukprot:MONOS_1684.1-p1 / transcript=MONOS_1684.1 / gene=MONOS_1684 / organism=Monocercomonoides_exilis_PA203 / gene_product=unspecified product / transcript_product=unspecified product / location=Mono_scaffold00031:88000-88233(-) / protein_length=78 / sequence_SO=supercontig / SO=protein_coding / is_pseudo=false
MLSSKCSSFPFLSTPHPFSSSSSVSSLFMQRGSGVEKVAEDEQSSSSPSEPAISSSHSSARAATNLSLTEMDNMRDG